MFTVAYVRVSTAEQSVESQVAELAAAGYEPTLTVREEGISGKTAAAERPAFAGMLTTLRQLNGSTRKRVVVTKVDRLGRDAEDILRTVRILEGLGAEVHVLQLGGVDLASPTGKLVLTTLAAVAEMERSLISERTKAGLARAAAEGRKGGRREALSPAQKTEVVAKIAAGTLSIRKAATAYGVSPTTIQKALKEA